MCQGCDHALGRHFMDVEGNVQCIVSGERRSSRGVLGTYFYACDCVNYVSEIANRDRARDAVEQKKMKAITDSLVAQARSLLDKEK